MSVDDQRTIIPDIGGDAFYLTHSHPPSKGMTAGTPG